jgi:dihydroflavonol-4-reductase
MKILITGADGLLGNNLVRELLQRGLEVRAFIEKGKPAPCLETLPIEIYAGDILDPQSLSPAFEDVSVVYHCAAATSVVPARNPMVVRVNVAGTQNVIDLCCQHAVQRLIYIGTANSFSFGSTEETAGREDTPYLSHQYALDYMDSKYEAQVRVLNAVKTRRLPALILNPTFMIGPYDTRPSSGAMLLAIKQGKIPGYAPGGKNYIAVKDVAVAAANALEMGRIGECYILGNHNLSYQQAFALFANCMGVKGPVLPMPAVLVLAFGRVNSLLGKWFAFHPKITYELARISCHKNYYSSKKARDELKLPNTPLPTAVNDCMRWFETNGYG